MSVGSRFEFRAAASVRGSTLVLVLQVSVSWGSLLRGECLALAEQSHKTV